MRSFLRAVRFGSRRSAGKNYSKGAPNAPNLQRLPMLEKYRIVTIEGCLPIPCAGTHLRNIREIGKTRLNAVEQLETDFRIYYDVEESPTV